MHIIYLWERLRYRARTRTSSAWTRNGERECLIWNYPENSLWTGSLKVPWLQRSVFKILGIKLVLMYTQALTCVKTSPFFFVAKGKGNRRPPHGGFSSTKSFTDGGIYNTCLLLLRRKSVPGVRIVECGAKEESEKHTLPHPLVVFFWSHLFALSPWSERLE